MGSGDLNLIHIDPEKAKVGISIVYTQEALFSTESMINLDGRFQYAHPPWSLHDGLHHSTRAQRICEQRCEVVQGDQGTDFKINRNIFVNLFINFLRSDSPRPFSPVRRSKRTCGTREIEWSSRLRHASFSNAIYMVVMTHSNNLFNVRRTNRARNHYRSRKREKLWSLMVTCSSTERLERDRRNCRLRMKIYCE